MNKIMEAHKRKLSPESSIVTAINGIADELYELRKENRDLQGELKNIAGSLDYVSQYLYDISWELKKNREKNLDLSEQVN
jgi:chromosome segregation ATPase